MKPHRSQVPVIIVITTALLAPSNAVAYVGPGAGIGFVGALVGLVTAIVTALWILFKGLARKVLRLGRKPTKPSPISPRPADSPPEQPPCP